MVTIVVSTYNQDKYLEECLQSIVNQSYKGWHCIIVQDDENKKSIEIITKFMESDIREKFEWAKTNDRGLSFTRNIGIGLLEFEFILFLDGDDKIHPEYLEKTVKFAEENPDFAFYYPDTQHFGDSNGYWISKEYNFIDLLNGNYIVSASLIRTDIFFDIYGFDENNFGYFEDYEFWLKLGSKGYYGKHLPEKLFYYRVHGESGMQSERTKKLGNVYMAYIYSQFPYLYPRELLVECKNVLDQYPADFMKMKPGEQMEWVKNNEK